jgi:monothiol glutaredoxin
MSKGELMELQEQIKNDIKNNSVMLYMKGTKIMPMCGFSATVVNILNAYEVEYETVNVLEDPEIRIKLSEYSNWPTIPQLFVNGELVGGCDIAMELHQKGELKAIFDKAE